MKSHMVSTAICGLVFSIFNPGVSQACEPVDLQIVSNLVRRIALEEHLDVDLALAVAGVESGMGKQQVSEAGAVGIMQLMPGTAADYGVTDRCDAPANIRAGIKYLKKLYDEFDDPLLMLAAYNAGPNRVYQKGGIPEFDETAKYIVKVMNRWKLSAKITPEKVEASAVNTHPETVAVVQSPWSDHHVWSADQ